MAAILSAPGEQSVQLVVPAGPADTGGYCEFAPAGAFNFGDLVTVTEQAQGGVQTTAITVLPNDRAGSAPDLGNRTITIVAGDGVTAVMFTNGGSKTAADDSAAAADPGS